MERDTIQGMKEIKPVQVRLFLEFQPTGSSLTTKQEKDIKDFVINRIGNLFIEDTVLSLVPDIKVFCTKVEIEEPANLRRIDEPIGTDEDYTTIKVPKGIKVKLEII